MKYGIREICDVVLKAKSTITIGNKKFYKGEPVIYFDSLKTSTLEGAATTVYAQGGRGNSRLVAWEGERTLTFTMEDALISTAGFMILSGAGLVEATETAPIYVHATEQAKVASVTDSKITIKLNGTPADTSKTGVDSDAKIYVMVLNDDGDVNTEPYIATIDSSDNTGKTIKIEGITTDPKYTPNLGTYTGTTNKIFTEDTVVLVDYYKLETGSNAQQIEITADKFGGNYYLEASTLFRNTNGVDMPAEFIIPNCKIQSNFTFTMASSGDPSTFTFTMDAFPDYTKFDRTKKVLAAIQVISEATTADATTRTATEWDYAGATGVSVEEEDY